MKFIIWSLFLLFNLSFAFDVATDYLSQILAITGKTTDKSFQFPISNAGDINNDGMDDIIIGGYGLEDEGKLESAYLIYGQSTFSSVDIGFETFTVTPAEAGIAITGTEDWDGFGTFVSGAGDIDGDENDDFMIGAYRKSNRQGRVYVVYGKSDLQNMNLLTPGLDPATTGFTISGNVDENYLGFSISKAGRINDDGLDDIIVGIHGKNNQKGAAVVIYGESKATRSNIDVNDPLATISPGTAGFSMLGKEDGDLFGYSVSNAGDVNDDGRDDVIVGAPGKDNRKGAVYVIYGSQSPVNIDLSVETLDPATTGFVVKGSAEGDLFGASVSAAGDFNGDGIDDIIIGANSTESGRGAVYIIYGSQTPSDIDLLTDPLEAASTGFVIKGAAPGDQFGFSVKSLGDLNGDGLSDVMVGAPGQGGSSQGAVHVIYGKKPESLSSDVMDLSTTPLDPVTTGFTFTRDVADGKFGYSISSGDFNDDQKTELFVGTMTNSNTAPSVGYVIGLSRK